MQKCMKPQFKEYSNLFTNKYYLLIVYIFLPFNGHDFLYYTALVYSFRVWCICGSHTRTGVEVARPPTPAEMWSQLLSIYFVPIIYVLGERVTAFKKTIPSCRYPPIRDGSVKLWLLTFACFLLTHTETIIALIPHSFWECPEGSSHGWRGRRASTSH